jgi:hypothetical protein
MDLTVGLAGSNADRIISGTAEDEINQALAEIGAAGGGSVTLLQGTYSLASGIWIDRDNVTLKGVGAGQSILQTIAAYTNSSSPIIEAFGVDNFTIQDLTVDGHSNDTLTNGIMTVQCTNGVIAECEVKLSENHNYGIWLVLSQDIQVLNNNIDGFTKTTGQEGIETWSSDNVLISGNTIKNIGGAGINLLSFPTPSYGDIEGHNTNIQVTNNIVTNAYIGTSVSVAGARSFGQIEIQGNTFSDIAYGVRLLTIDRVGGAPDSESADIDHPQSLHDIDISNNQVNLFIQSGFGILLQNSSSPDVVSFSNIDASNNVISNAPGQAFGVFGFDHFTLDDNILTGTAQHVSGSPYNDTIRGSVLANVLDGGAGTDTVDYSSATQSVVIDLPSHIATGAQIGTDTLSGIENVRTGSGNDAVAGDGATNVLDGGAGIDTISYYKVSSGVVLDLAAQVGVDGTSRDTLLNFENANGSAFNDAISGTNAANVLNGLGGIDTISYYRASQGVVIDLAAQIGRDGTSTDTLLNFENANGSAYNDAISSNGGTNVLDGLGGIDTISYYISAQGVTIDLAAGTGVSGGVTDTLRNFENANGSSHADSLIGNGAANVLNGLGGTDTLTGGGGFDFFEFTAGQAHGDIIVDFTGNGAAAGDAIRLVGFGTAAQGATFTQVNVTQWQIHSGLDGHNETITLSNGAAVHGSDFFFV